MNYKLFTHTPKIQIHKHMQTNTDNKAETHTHTETYGGNNARLADSTTCNFKDVGAGYLSLHAGFMDTTVLHFTETCISASPPVVH